jgi:NADPH:quinone reductase-like Zn-dependent oxidoreductase
MKAVMLKGKGGLDQLEVVDLPLIEPGPGQLRVKVLAAGAGFTDVMMRESKYMFAPPWPFVGGYELVGVVDAIGKGVEGFRLGQRVAALTVYGAWSEYFVREAEHFVPVPDGLDPGEAVALILNYVTAYQMLHRSAKLQPGQTALVSGANGGVGTALLELGRLAGAKMLGASSPKHFDLVRSYGADPIESRTRPLDQLVREKLPDGVDVAFDGLGGKSTREHIRATRKGGTVVGYGFMQARGSRFAGLRGILTVVVGAPLAGRRGTFYGITSVYRKDKTPLKEDLPKLFALLAEKKIAPRIAARLGLLDGRRAEEMLERGGVAGKIVLIA